MVGFVLLLSGVALLGVAVAWWLGRRPADCVAARPVSAGVTQGQDLLPASGDGEKENGLAAFYAYQMAAGRIERRR